MNKEEQIIVYDCIQSIQKYAPLLVETLNKEYNLIDTRSHLAYKQCMYSVAVRLSSLFTEDELKEQKERIKSIQLKVDEFFKQKKQP